MPVILADLPKTELEFDERFGDEEACRDFWMSIRWPDGFVCPRCQHRGGWRRRGRDEWVCASRICGKETSVRTGTVLHGSRKPIRDWLRAMFYMTASEEGISALGLQRAMGFASYETAMRWLRELRRVMMPLEGTAALGDLVEAGGGTLRVHVDGSRKWVVGAVGVGKRVRLRVVDSDGTAQGLCSLVFDSVHPGGRVVTDHPAAADLLAARGFHPELRPSPLSLDGVPRLRWALDLFDSGLRLADQAAIGSRHLQLYLDEYCFRYDGRGRRDGRSAFRELAERASSRQCVPYWRSSGRVAPHAPARPAFSRRLLC